MAPRVRRARAKRGRPTSDVEDVHRLGAVWGAAFDDPRFESERLLAVPLALLGPLEQIRSQDELEALWSERFGGGPSAGARYRLSRGIPGRWGADVAIRELEVVTLRNVGRAEIAEAVVRARVRVRRWPRVRILGRLSRALRRDDRVMWLTLLGPPGEDWKLTRVDFGAQGEFHLAAERVPEPGHDPALRDAVIRELAEEDAVREPGAVFAGSEDDATRLLDRSATRRLLDLSLADGRFGPAVVEAAVRSLIRAWRGFAIGDENAYDTLAALSSYEIAAYARHADLPASMRAIDVVALVPSPRPALFVRIEAVVQFHDGARERNLWWKLELDDELPQHWRLVDAYARPDLRALRRPFAPPAPNAGDDKT